MYHTFHVSDVFEKKCIMAVIYKLSKIEKIKQLHDCIASTYIHTAVKHAKNSNILILNN